MISALSGRAAVALLALWAALALLSGGGMASANGAVRLVVIDETAGPYLVRVGVLPGAPTLGPLHLSIRLLEAEGGATVADATVSVAISGPGAPGRTEAANSPQNPELYEGNLWLDALGQWSVTLDIDSPRGQATHAFGIRAAADRGFNLVWVVLLPLAAALLAGSLAWSARQRRRRRSGG